MKRTRSLDGHVAWCDLQAIIAAMREQHMPEVMHQLLPLACFHDVEDQLVARAQLLAQVHAQLLGLGISPLSASPGSDEELAHVAELIMMGDGGFYMDRLVTPLFTFLAHEVSLYWSTCSAHAV